MALTQVTGPYPIFTDLDGTPLDDGYLYIGAINDDPETNPIQVFFDSNLTIPATQPIRTSNGYAYRNGTPALLYAGGEFSITIRNKRNEFVLYSPVGYGFDPAAVSASVVKNDFIGDGVEVNFTLSAAPSTILATNVFINGVYQEKDSYSLLGNVITFSIAPPLSSSIEVMTNETGVINSGNATAISYTLTAPGAVAQTVQTKLEQYVSVKDFGAVGDGVTDDTAAFNTAIAYLNTISYSAVLVLEGDFVINGSLTPITTPRKVIDGYGATINHDGGTLFSFGVGGNTGIVKGIRYSCPTSPTAGTCFISLEGCNQCEVRDITGRVNQFAKIGLSSFVGGYIFENVNVSTINGVQTVIDHGTGAVSQINNLVLTAIGTSRVLDQTTPTGATATAIKFSNAWDTAIWSGLLVNGYLYGLDINRTTASVNISNGRVTNFYFDFCANGIRMKNTALGGGINNWYFSNGWSVGMDGYSIDIDTGSFANIKFEAVQALLAGKNDWRINGSGFTDITIENCVGQFANRFNATNTGTDQDDFVALSGLFRVFNSRFGQSANNFVTAGVPNWQGRYGMNIATAFITKYFIQGNQMQGLTADCNFSTANNILPVASEYSGFISNNMVYSGASRPAYAITDTLAAPPSGVVQTYRNPFYLELSIYGGTVTDIMHNGVTIATGGPVSLQLSPGDTWSVTYTVAPTIRRVFKP
jgi:hypothetical protein